MILNNFSAYFDILQIYYCLHFVCLSIQLSLLFVMRLMRFVAQSIAQ
jgi:hypothetical protein